MTVYSLVPCTPEGGVRLTGGDRPGRGTVWVCISGTWSTVCDNYWNIPDARVVCGQLGYNNGKGKSRNPKNCTSDGNLN